MFREPFGPIHLPIILAAVLILVDPGRLPEPGKGIKDFKKDIGGDEKDSAMETGKNQLLEPGWKGGGNILHR